MTVLGDCIARVRAGTGDAREMLSVFRDSLVLMPQTAAGAVVAADFGGVRWLLAFTTPAELATWVIARGSDGGAEQPYLSVLGSRLLDVAVPDVGVPAGVAIDVAGTQPMMLPPVRGIVGEGSAVVTGSVRGGAS
jgi:hypothetical protein